MPIITIAALKALFTNGKVPNTSSYEDLIDTLDSGKVTNGDTHDHNGGDGAQINHTTLSNIGTNTHPQIDTHISAVAPHSGHALSANGVTNGNSHDHNGGDGGQINHTTLSNIGTNTHAQIDTHISAVAPHSGHALSANGVTNGNSHDHNGGDGATLVTGSLGNDIVDDTKVGNRVPQFYRRQGANAGNWASQGTTNYTPGMVRMQAGAAIWTGNAWYGTVSVTFPVAFSNVPLVWVQAMYGAGSQYFVWNVGGVAASGFTIYWRTWSGAAISETYWDWLAIGPE